MKKNEKYFTIGGILIFLAGVILLVKNQRGLGGLGKIPKDQLLSPDMDLTPYKQGGLNLIAEAMKDSAFRDKVRLLQSKMNLYFSNHPEVEFPHSPLEVDGLLGDNTLKGIVYIFGDQTLPIKEKTQIDYYIKSLK